jgi:hypothetical protein
MNPQGQASLEQHSLSNQAPPRFSALLCALRVELFAPGPLPQNPAVFRLDSIHETQQRSSRKGPRKYHPLWFFTQIREEPNFLPRVIPARPTFSVVLTDWLSMMRAEGCSSRLLLAWSTARVILDWETCLKNLPLFVFQVAWVRFAFHPRMLDPGFASTTSSATSRSGSPASAP